MQNIDEEDDEVVEESPKEKLERQTKRQSIVKTLMSMDLFRYGAVIHENDVESVMAIKKKDVSNDKWNLAINCLRETLKVEGFFVTSRGRGDDLYILQPHEMPDHNDKRNKVNFRDLKRRQRALHMIDSSTLSSDRQKKLEFEILRNASFEIDMSKRLNERCRH